MSPHKKLEECPEVWRTEIGVLNRLSEAESATGADSAYSEVDSELQMQVLAEITIMTGKRVLSLDSLGESSAKFKKAKGKRRNQKTRDTRNSDHDGDRGRCDHG